MIVFIITILMFKSGQPYKAAVFQYHPEKVEGKPEYTMLRNLEVYKTQVENAKDKAYKAAVYQHHPIKVEGDSPEDTILKNFEVYRKQIEHAKNKNVDIIVFPEYGLTSLNVNPEEYAIEIMNDNKIIKEIQDMALQNNMYIVVNLLEKSNEDQPEYYNTNLVFGRNGNITARYRKINLSKEEKKNNLKPGNETVIFATDFGITFSVFTSWDILYEKPAREVTKNIKVTDILHPASLKSYLPFYNAITLQQAYASTHEVNLLTASYVYPEKEYDGSSNINANDKSNSKLIIEEIKKIVRKQESTTSCELGRPITAYITSNLKSDVLDIPFDNFTIVNSTQKQISTQVCDKNNDFCCNFTITVREESANDEESANEFYKLIVYDGEDPLNDERRIHFCSLSCVNYSSSCEAKIDIKMEKQFQNHQDFFQMPVTLNRNLTSITDYIYCETDSIVTLSTLTPHNQILYFGIFETFRNKEDVTRAVLKKWRPRPRPPIDHHNSFDPKTFGIILVVVIVVSVIVGIVYFIIKKVQSQ